MTQSQDAQKGIGCAVLLLIGLAFGIYVALAGDDDGGESADEEVSRFGACLAAEDFIRDRLKAPSTADFQNCLDVGVIRTGNRWKLEGHVDAENSFGAKLRNRYVIVLDYIVGRDVWRLVSLEFD